MNQLSHQNFYGLGIAPGILSTLDRLKFTIPTPIQSQTIPIALEGKDVIGIAQTGTGKTMAFGIPLLQRLAPIPGRGLILVPTRELAMQVEESLKKIAPALNVKTTVLIGGASFEDQVKKLKANPKVIIATPGRLIDHLRQKTLKLNDVRIVVLDEADRMLDMGFAPDIKQIMAQVPKERQTMLFSATMPPAILLISRTYMKIPMQIEIAPTGTAASGVRQELFITKKEAKRKLLYKLLNQYKGSVLIFTRTKIYAQKIAGELKAHKFTAIDIHSDRSLGQRREALEGFKNGRYRILVATDIAARGLDVKGIELVINYDLPDEAENYIHRIGRTGRAGGEGLAVSFATPDQAEGIQQIEKLMRKALPVVSDPELSEELFVRKSKETRPGFRSPSMDHGRRFRSRRR